MGRLATNMVNACQVADKVLAKRCETVSLTAF